MSRPIPISEIVHIVSIYYHVRPSQITAKGRTAHLVRIRGMAIYLCYKWSGQSLAMIGACFGGRDHTTIMHGRDKAICMIQADFDFRQQADHLEEKLKVEPIMVDESEMAWACHA